MATKQWNWKATDLDEFSKCIAKIQNPILKQVLIQQFQIERSKFITQQLKLHSVVVTDNSTSNSQNSAREILEWEEKLANLKQHGVPSKKDEEEFFVKQIKGYSQKLNSLIATLPNESTERIKEALICCNGKEENTVEALITNMLPPRPALPFSFLIEFKKKMDTQIKELEAKIAAAKSSTPSTSSMGSSSLQSPVVDLISEFLQHKNDMSYVKLKIQERSQLLKQQIQKLKDNSTKKAKQVQKIKTTNHVNRAQDQLSDDSVSNTNKLYLPGEYEAIESGEPRVFKFKTERTFANETSHIHFRVAESVFFAMCQNMWYKVEQVQYIVTPELVKRFEMKRSEIAFSMGKKYSDLKPIFCMDSSQNKNQIEDVRLGGITNVSKVLLSNNSTHLSSYINDKPQQAVIFLVLLGKTNQMTEKSKKADVPHGFDSCSFGDGSFKVKDSSMILPYYIVSYTDAGVNQNHLGKGLSEEWNSMEQEAESDRFMDDCKRFYDETLTKKDKEVRQGKAIDATDLWFDKVYNKRFEKEKQFAITGNDDIYGDGKVIAFDEEGNEILLNTPSTAQTSQTKDDIFEIEEEEEDGYVIEEDYDEEMSDSQL